MKGESSTHFSFNQVKTETPSSSSSETDVEQSIPADLIKDENSTEDQVLLENNHVHHASSVVDMNELKSVKLENDLTAPYLLHKSNWEASGTAWNVPYNPMVEVENLSFDEQSSNNITPSCSFLMKSDNPTCSTSLGDTESGTGKADYAMNSTLKESVKVKVEHSVHGPDDVKAEDVTDVLAADCIKQECGLMFEDDQERETCLEGSVVHGGYAPHHETGSCEWEKDYTFPCTLCTLVFSAEAALSDHVYRLHGNEGWEKGKEMNDVSHNSQEVVNIRTVCDPYSGMRIVRENISNQNKDLIVDEHVSYGNIHRVGHENTSNQNQNKLTCTQCFKSFTRKDSLLRHEKIHNGEKPYSCSVCGKAFGRDNDLKTHMRIHNGEKPYKCNICGKTSRWSGDLQKHMRIHRGEKPHKCSTCGKGFIQSRDLQKHITTHGEKSYTCTVCDKVFLYDESLQSHMRYHFDEKLFTCNVCAKAFISSKALKIHLKTHEGVKPYKCNLCSKAFVKKRSLMKHLMIHNGEAMAKKKVKEKPYKCSVCSKAFVQRTHLETHMISHIKQKTFKCNVCNKAFRWKSNFLRHSRSHRENRVVKLFKGKLSCKDS